MRYRLTCLTPVLVGDGRKLAPIDYMVWKDQINVLDQRRIFRLLAKGPRLEGYLAQLKKAEKLDFASWGGFAQNFADRRIPFESPIYSTYWSRAAGESLHIPTFAAGAAGPFLPGAAIKGALRTGMLYASWKEGMLRDILARAQADRAPRRPAEISEEQALGSSGTSRMRLVSAGDSLPVGVNHFKIYLVRVSTLLARGAGSYALGWKLAPRGSVEGSRAEESTPVFAEMANPGTTFEGDWDENRFFCQPEIRRLMRWPDSFDRSRIFEAANDYAARLLELHKQYAVWTGLELLRKNIEELETKLAGIRESGGCLLSIGWGAGLLGKSAWLDTGNAEYRQLLQHLSVYGKALSSNLPFPKTRHIVFLNNKPAAQPGWAMLEVI